MGRIPAKNAKPARKARGRAKPAGSGPLRYLFYFLVLAVAAAVPASIMLYDTGALSATALGAIATIEVSLLLPFSVLGYLSLRGRSALEIIGELGLGRKALSLRIAAYALLLFVAMMLLAAGVGAFSEATGIQLPTNVDTVLGNMPLYLLLFAAVIAPVNEEVFFRGFLVNRIGIVGSAVIFGFIHYVSYASVSEFVAALVFGLLAGYVFKRTGSLYASIGAHILVNMLAISSIVLLAVLR